MGEMLQGKRILVMGSASAARGMKRASTCGAACAVAEFAACPSSPAADCCVGQVSPVCDGWVGR